MISFQTPTYPVIISNLGWCFFVENSFETFKDNAKVHPWKKKRKQFRKLATQQNLLKEKKQAPFFWKFCVKYTLPKKQKELFWKLLVQKESVISFGSQKEEEIQSLYHFV